MGSSLRRFVSVTLALVLSGTPAVAAACAALCAPAAEGGHAGHHASGQGAQSDAQDDSVSVSPAEHQHHHDDATDTSGTSGVPDAVGGPVAPLLPPAAVVASVRDCCTDLDGVGVAPARVQTRTDVAAPLVATPAIDADACAARASAAHDPPASPPPPPAPVRSPLILRI